MEVRSENVQDGTQRIVQRFVDQRPIAVMVRAVLERQFSDRFFDSVFEEVAQRQYTRELTLSACAQLLAPVTLGQATSVNAAFPSYHVPTAKLLQARKKRRPKTARNTP